MDVKTLLETILIWIIGLALTVGCGVNIIWPSKAKPGSVRYWFVPRAAKTNGDLTPGKVRFYSAILFVGGLMGLYAAFYGTFLAPP